MNWDKIGSGIAGMIAESRECYEKEIHALTADNARLREALERIANRMIAYAEPDEAAYDMKSIARQALKEEM